MTTPILTADALHVRFTTAEKLTGLLRDLTVPRSAVVRAEVVRDGLAAARGLRAPGLGLPGLRKIGTWYHRGTRTAVSVRRARPAVRIELTGQRYDALLLDVERPEELAAALAS